MPTPHGLEHGLQGPWGDQVQSTVERNNVSKLKGVREVRRGMRRQSWVGVFPLAGIKKQKLSSGLD